VTNRTLARLWSDYTGARVRLRELKESSEARVRIERETKQLRDRLLLNYAPLVKYTAGQVGARMTGLVEQEDFISWGILGLISAIETYDPNKGTKFQSYAISKIRWSILDELRKQDWIPRRARTRMREIEQVKQSLSQQLRRAPADEEVAEALNFSVKEYSSFVGEYARSNVGSLDARLFSEDGAGIDFRDRVSDPASAEPDQKAEQAIARERLVSALKTLKEQERVVATFYFYEGLTLKEIGQAMNLTESRISQILRRALDQLRNIFPDSRAFSSFL
jgi:RNA polymerase sigma factor for flagellar operon FliA